MPRSETIELTATRLLWREQARALPRSMRYALRRLFRRESRLYLVDDATGTVLARFTTPGDGTRFLDWLDQTHTWAFNSGKEFIVANPVLGADPSDPGPA